MEDYPSCMVMPGFRVGCRSRNWPSLQITCKSCSPLPVPLNPLTPHQNPDRKLELTKDWKKTLTLKKVVSQTQSVLIKVLVMSHMRRWLTTEHLYKIPFWAACPNQGIYGYINISPNQHMWVRIWDGKLHNWQSNWSVLGHSGTGKYVFSVKNSAGLA